MTNFIKKFLCIYVAMLCITYLGAKQNGNFTYYILEYVANVVYKCFCEGTFTCFYYAVVYKTSQKACRPIIIADFYVYMWTITMHTIYSFMGSCRFLLFYILIMSTESIYRLTRIICVLKGHQIFIRKKINFRI